MLETVRLVYTTSLAARPDLQRKKFLAASTRGANDRLLCRRCGREGNWLRCRGFRALCDHGVAKLWAIATAANGKAFSPRPNTFAPPRLMSSPAARGRVYPLLAWVSGSTAGRHRRDLGGRLARADRSAGMQRIKAGLTLPLEGWLQDVSSKSIKKAEKIVRATLDDASLLESGKGPALSMRSENLRALARLHMWQTGYPLHVMHGYVMPAREAFEFSSLVHRVDPRCFKIEWWPMRDGRWLAALGARELVRIADPRTDRHLRFGCVRACSIRCRAQRARQGSVIARQASSTYCARVRPPRALIATDRFIASSGSREEQRLRHVACLLADIGWRAHPITAATIAQHHAQCRVRRRPGRYHLLALACSSGTLG